MSTKFNQRFSRVSMISHLSIRVAMTILKTLMPQKNIACHFAIPSGAAPIALIAASILLSSCISQAPIPQDRFYRLPELTSTNLPQGILTNTIAVTPFKMQGIYNERNLLYIEATKPLELQRYHYRYWASSPNYLIQDNLISYLRTTSIADNVYHYQSNLEADRIVSGRVLRFDRVLEGSGSSVIINMELQVSNGNINSLPLLKKQYSSSATINNKGFNNVVEAYGRALNKIYDAFISDIEPTLTQ